MLVECCNKRVGPTPVEHGKKTYLFTPPPDPRWYAFIDGEEKVVNGPALLKDSKGNVVKPYPGSSRPSTSICEINQEEVLERLLGKGYENHLGDYPYWNERLFRPYDVTREVIEEKPINLSGYAIVKHQDGRAEGYRVENINKKPKEYAGSNGTWSTSVQGLVPFESEFLAWQWLKDEVQQMGSEEENRKVEAIFQETKSKRSR